MQPDSPEMTLPLSGVRVVEFCQIAAGPFCGMLLADFGADLVKVENPDGGDGMRNWPPITEGFSENFASLNRNKRSIALDLKAPEALDIARRLCVAADVVIENNRPGAMDRLGLGYDAIRAENPKIVYCSMSGYGQTGPRARQGGYDVTIQAMAGVMSVTGEPEGGPVKCGVPISDFSTGLYGAMSVCAALRKAAATGQGEYIDISLFGSTLAIAALQTSEYFGTGNDPRRMGAAHPRNAPYEAFRASDDYFVLAAGNNVLWSRVCEAVGLPELVGDPRFAENKDRAANQVALRVILETAFTTQTVTYWVETFERLGVPCGRINTYAEALADPQVKEMGWISEIELPGGVTTRTFGSPVRFGGVSPGIRRAPPALDQDRDDILKDLDIHHSGKEARTA